MNVLIKRTCEVNILIYPRTDNEQTEDRKLGTLTARLFQFNTMLTIYHVLECENSHEKHEFGLLQVC